MTIESAINETATEALKEPKVIRCRDCDFWTKQKDSLQGRCALWGGGYIQQATGFAVTQRGRRNMNTKDNLYVNAADICLSVEYWPDANCSVEIHAEVDHPVRTINLDEYTKKVQDDMMEALRVVDLIDDNNTRKTILGKSSSIMLTIRGSSGHEFMERYEKWKKDEENKLLREQIEAAKKLLREHGFEVVTV